MIHDKGSLWAKVLSGKYMKNKVQLEHVQPKHESSNAWQMARHNEGSSLSHTRTWYSCSEWPEYILLV